MTTFDLPILPGYLVLPHRELVAAISADPKLQEGVAAYALFAKEIIQVLEQQVAELQATGASQEKRLCELTRAIEEYLGWSADQQAEDGPAHLRESM